LNNCIVYQLRFANERSLDKDMPRTADFSDLKWLSLILAESMPAAGIPFGINKYPCAKDHNICPQNCKFAIFGASLAWVVVDFVHWPAAIGY
jgi:hypothetical protein